MLLDGQGTDGGEGGAEDVAGCAKQDVDCGGYACGEGIQPASAQTCIVDDALSTDYTPSVFGTLAAPLLAAWGGLFGPLDETADAQPIQECASLDRECASPSSSSCGGCASRETAPSPLGLLALKLRESDDNAAPRGLAGRPPAHTDADTEAGGSQDDAAGETDNASTADSDLSFGSAVSSWLQLAPAVAVHASSSPVYEIAGSAGTQLSAVAGATASQGEEAAEVGQLLQAAQALADVLDHTCQCPACEVPSNTGGASGKAAQDQDSITGDGVAGGPAAAADHGALRALHCLVAWLGAVPVGGEAAAARRLLRARLARCLQVRSVADGGAPVEEVTCHALPVEQEQDPPCCECAAWSPPIGMLQAACPSLAALPRTALRKHLASETRVQLQALLACAADEAAPEEACGYCARCVSALLEDLPAPASREDAFGACAIAALTRAWSRLRVAEDSAARQASLKALAAMAGPALLTLAPAPLDESEARAVAGAWAVLLLREAEQLQDLPAVGIASTARIAAPGFHVTSNSWQTATVRARQVGWAAEGGLELCDNLVGQTRRCLLDPFGHDGAVSAECFRALGALLELRGALLEAGAEDKAAMTAESVEFQSE